MLSFATVRKAIAMSFLVEMQSGRTIVAHQLLCANAITCSRRRGLDGGRFVCPGTHDSS